MPGRAAQAPPGAQGGPGKKLRDFAVWLSGVDRLDCEACAAVWEEHERRPPCLTCRPELEPENAPAVYVYAKCSGQWIMGGMGDPVDLDMRTVTDYADRLFPDAPGPDRLELTDQVMDIAARVRKSWTQDREKKGR